MANAPPDFPRRVRENPQIAIDLLKAARPLVAMTFDEARAAEDIGQSLLYCRRDVLNPCFSNRPQDVPGKHWGGGEACPECNLRAAIAVACGTHLARAHAHYAGLVREIADRTGETILPEHQPRWIDYDGIEHPTQESAIKATGRCYDANAPVANVGSTS